MTRSIWEADIAGWPVRLPIVPIKPDFAISLLMVIDQSVAFGDHVGRALAQRVHHLEPDIVVGPATLGIPIAIETTRHLGLDRYVILQKSPKIHLADALVETITSITSRASSVCCSTARPCRCSKGGASWWSTMSSRPAPACPARSPWSGKAGGNVVGAGVVLTEAHDWKDVMGRDAALVTGLGHIPQFRPASAGGWEPIPETF